MAWVSGSMVGLARHLSTLHTSLPRHLSSLPRHLSSLSTSLHTSLPRRLSSLPPSLPPVLHQPALQQFSLQVEGHEAAVLRYTSSPSSPPTLTLYSTVVPASLEGRGVGKLLADAAFGHAVREGGGLRLTCWYLSGYLARHPRREVQELLVE